MIELKVMLHYLAIITQMKFLQWWIIQRQSELIELAARNAKKSATIAQFSEFDLVKKLKIFLIISKHIKHTSMFYNLCNSGKCLWIHVEPLKMTRQIYWRDIGTALHRQAIKTHKEERGSQKWKQEYKEQTRVLWTIFWKYTNPFCTCNTAKAKGNHA